MKLGGEGMLRSYLISCLLGLGIFGCAEETIVTETEASPETAAAAETCLLEAETGSCNNPKNAEQAPEAATPPPKPSQATCNKLGIPSWEGVVSELTAFRCEKCHNANFAWKGVFLTNYQQFKANAVLSEARIALNNLTEKLDPIEQKIFLDFFKSGMPEKERDCVELKAEK